jgi:hypothetical protein
MKTKIILVALVNLIVSGCTLEPLKMNLEKGKNDPSLAIKSLCTYYDTIYISGISGCYGKVNVESADHFDYHDATARWYTSAASFVLTYNNRYGFKEVEETTEYDLTKNTPVSIAVVDYGAFPTKSYSAKIGKLFLTRLANGKLRADWCNITFKDKNGYTYACSGGFLIPD